MLFLSKYADGFYHFPNFNTTMNKTSIMIQNFSMIKSKFIANFQRLNTSKYYSWPFLDSKKYLTLTFFYYFQRVIS